MMTFDGWDARFYGDAMALPDDALMHFRTKGSKNGVRRFQLLSGEWTPLGLRERKKREGWGEGEKSKKTPSERVANREAARAARLDRKQAVEQRRANRVEAFKQRREQRSLKNVSDDELRKRIERVKLEREYKELTKSPVVAVGEQMIKNYLAVRKEKQEREDKEKKFEKEMIDARARLYQAEADRAYAKKRGNIAARKAEAKAKLKKEKNAERKATIRGAISQVANNIINRKGSRYVKSIPDESVLKRGKNRVKNIISNNKAKKQNANDWLVKGEAARIAIDAKKRAKAFNSYGS